MSGTALVRRPSTTLVRSVRAVAWELRNYWAKGLRVSLSINGDEARVEGFVTVVSASDAYSVVDGVHVPLERVLAVHRPSRLGDTTYDEGTRWRGLVPRAARHDPNQLELPFGDLG